MMYTTVPTMIITLIIFTVAGFVFDHSQDGQVMSFAASLKETFHISAALMIVPIATGILIAKRVAPIITLFISALLAAVFVYIGSAGSCLCLIIPTGFIAADSRCGDDQCGFDVQRRLHDVIWFYTIRDRKRDVEFLGIYPWNGRNDEYDLADYLRDVLRWRDDSQRHVGNDHFRLYALYATPCQYGRLDGIFRFDTEYLYGRPIHLHHPDREYVQGNLSEERIRKSPAEPYNRRCRDRNFCIDSMEYVWHDASHYLECTDINLSSILLF